MRSPRQRLAIRLNNVVNTVRASEPFPVLFDLPVCWSLHFSSFIFLCYGVATETKVGGCREIVPHVICTVNS